MGLLSAGIAPHAGPGPDTRLTAFEIATHPATASAGFARWLADLNRHGVNWGEVLLRELGPSRTPGDAHSILLGAALIGWVTIGHWGPTRQQQADHCGARMDNLAEWSFRPGICNAKAARMPAAALKFIERMHRGRRLARRRLHR